MLSESFNSLGGLTYTVGEDQEKCYNFNGDKSTSNMELYKMVSVEQSQIDKNKMLNEQLPMMVFDVMDAKWCNKEEKN